MCTASWSFDSEATVLCFNRDERKSRPRATPPAPRRIQNTLCIAPRDEVGQGTWILVNEFGLCVFLLNNYGAGTRRIDGPVISRGELPHRFADCVSVSDAFGRFSSVVDTEELQPFHLCFLDRRCARCLSWNGVRMSELDVTEGFLTTSSFRTAEVEAYRWVRFRALREAKGADAEAWHLRLHEDSENADPAFNPFMLRPESETHCMSIISIGDTEARFDYRPRVLDRFDWEPTARTVISLARPA